MDQLQIKLTQAKIPSPIHPKDEDELMLWWPDQDLFCQMEEGKYVVSKVTIMADSKAYNNQHYFETVEETVEYLQSLF